MSKILIKQNSNKEKRVIKASDVLHHAHYGVDLPLINVKVTVHFENLLEIHTSTYTLKGVRQKVYVLRSLVEIINLLIVKESENVIIKFYLALFEKCLIVYPLLGLQTDKEVIEILIDGVHEIRMIEK